MLKDSKLDTINCPCCGAEYLPVEIFIPEAFFGRPKHIKRNQYHKIEDIVGSYTNLNEQYICDYCNTPFRITAKLQFSTKPELKFDFDSDYTTSLKKQQLFMTED